MLRQSIALYLFYFVGGFLLEVLAGALLDKKLVTVRDMQSRLLL